MPGLNLGGLALPRTPISSSVASWVVNRRPLQPSFSFASQNTRANESGRLECGGHGSRRERCALRELEIGENRHVSRQVELRQDRRTRA
jgi:hypothetical protein